MRWSSKRSLGVAAGLSILGGGLAWEFLPALRWGGAAIAGTAAPLPPLGGTLDLPKGGTILCEGDSLTYGSDRFGGTQAPINGAGSRRVSTPFPETLARLLGGGVAVLNHGYPADTVERGSQRWSPAVPADIVVLMYGTNDANPRGWRTAVPIPRYRDELGALARRHLAQGATVMILAPPPAGTRYAEAAIAPYRVAAREVAAREGAAFLDPAESLAGMPVPLQWDGLHLRGEAAARLAEGVARRIRVR